MPPSHRVLLPKGPVLFLLGALLGWSGPADAQVFHRSRCSRPDCREEVFREEVDRMIRTEGALAADRDHGDLEELKGRILLELERHPGDASLWMALSEAELGLGDPTPAMAAAARALELGADTSLVMRAQAVARMRMPGGEVEGARRYLDAASRMTRESAPRFMVDYSPMLNPFELDWWRSTDLETRGRWARDFWEHRAALAGVPVEQRIAEHMRRVAEASRLYAPSGTGSGASGDADVLRHPELRMLPYDDRGLVYIRRGPPLRELRVASDIFSGLPATTWLYASVEGNIDAFHFARSLHSGSSHRLVVAPACDPTYVGSIYNGGLVTVSDGWVMSAAGSTDDATRAAVSCFSNDAFSRRANARQNAIVMRRETMRALMIESPRAPFERPMPAFFDFYMFRGPEGTTEVVTPVVVPVAEGAPQPVEVTVTFADYGGGAARRDAASSTMRDEVRNSIVSDGEGWGVTYARTMAQPADSAAFRVIVREPDDPAQGGMWGGTIGVRSFAAHGLKMSDLVVAGPGPGTWTRGSTRLFLLPARSFRPGATASIFYELYDLAPGSTYVTELILRPSDEGLAARLWRRLSGSGEVRVRFESRAPDDAGATLQELRSLGMPTEEGRYTLTVRVTGPRNQNAESSRAIVVAGDAAEPSGAQVAPPATDPTD